MANTSGVNSLRRHRCSVRPESAITGLINQAAEDVDGPIALYAVREIDDTYRPLDEAVIDATPRGSDIGSEGRVANIIRNAAKRVPTRFISHPSLDELRDRRVDAIFVVDDFIGSGKRSSKYISALWQSRSLRSWVSYHRLKLMAVAFSGTSEGIAALNGVPVTRLCTLLVTAPRSKIYTGKTHA